VRRAIPEIIKALLKEGKKSPNELLEGTRKKTLELESSFTEQNYYYHLKRLVKRGEVRKIFVHKYELVKEEGKIDRLNALEHIRIIKTDRNEEVLLSRIDQLKTLCARKRVARFPGVRLRFRECLENPTVTGNSRIFGEFVFMLAQVLSSEEGRSSADSKEIVQDVLLRTSESIISAVEASPDFLVQGSILFLGKTGKEEAVHLLFKKIKNNGSSAEQGIHDLTTALKNLYEKYSKLIDTYIDDLIRNGDDTVRKVAKQIRSDISMKVF